MKKTRILALILVCAMMFTLFTGCGSSYGTIDGRAIDKDLFAALASYTMYQYFYGVTDEQTIIDGLAEDAGDGKTVADVIKERVLSQMKEYYAIEKIAKEHGISLNAEEKKAVEDTKQEQITSMGGRAAFTESLKNSGLSEETFDYLAYNSALSRKLFTATYSQGGVHEVDESEIIGDMTANFVRVVHILIQAQPNSADFAQKKALAEKTLARVKAGEDFTALINEVNEDPGMESAPTGYLFDKEGYTLSTDGSQMVQEFTDASWALEVGQTSGLVQTSYGYHIIKRLPLDEAFIRENMTAYYSYYASLAFNFEVAEVMAAMTYETNDNYNNINLLDFMPKQTATNTPATNTPAQ